jgi:hypothetical protein
MKRTDRKGGRVGRNGRCALHFQRDPVPAVVTGRASSPSVRLGPVEAPWSAALREFSRGRVPVRLTGLPADGRGAGLRGATGLRVAGRDRASSGLLEEDA